MDIGQARVRQAHKLPSERWDAVVLVVALFVLIAILVAPGNICG